MRIPLSKPIWVAGKEVRELELREPTWGDLADVSWTLGPNGLSLRTGDLQLVAARLAGMHVDVIAALTPADGAAIWGYLTPFLFGSTPTPPSPPRSSSSSEG